MRVLILTLSRAKPIITVHMLCKISVARCRKTLLANNLHYMTKKQLINMLLTTHCLDKQEWLQYSPLLCNNCSVARERVQQINPPQWEHRQLISIGEVGIYNYAIHTSSVRVCANTDLKQINPPQREHIMYRQLIPIGEEVGIYNNAMHTSSEGVC